MSWDYAEMSKQAKEYGGPEQYADHLYNTGKESGLDEGRSQGVLIGTTGTFGFMVIIKLFTWIKEKRREKKAAEYKKSLVLAMQNSESSNNDNNKNTN